ncbi:MAG: DUF3347 domain-containing protein [Chitinophagaceae bacterium]
MKTAVLSIAIIATIFSACGNDNKSSKEANTTTDTTATNNQASNTTEKSASINEIVTAYLQLKNALVSDNSNEAATSGKQLQEATQKIDAASFTADQKKMYDEVKAEITEHAEHISSNGGNIAHQREHFDMLSQDVYDLVKTVKPNQALYKDHCPMFNNKKGAIWLSETREIKNPYYGNKMLTCGTVKEEIK